MMNRYEKWLSLKDRIRILTEELHEVESDIWLAAEKDGMLNPNGSKTSDVGEFKITITHNDSVKVNKELAEKSPHLFRWKAEFNKLDYKLLTDSQRKVVDEAITITPMKPQFKIVKKEEL